MGAIIITSVKYMEKTRFSGVSNPGPHRQRSSIYLNRSTNTLNMFVDENSIICCLRLVPWSVFKADDSGPRGTGLYSREGQLFSHN